MQKRKKRYAISDIAAIAGVAPSTVSRVLNRSGYVSSETERRVRDVIAKLEYVPSQIARGLRVGHSPIIGILVPDVVGEFLSQFSMELQAALFRRSFIPILLSTAYLSDAEAECARIQSALNPSGWVRVLVPAYPKRPNVPTVFLDYIGGGLRENEARVHNDEDQIGYLATRELLDRGCRHVAMMMYNRIPTEVNYRYKGYQRALLEAKIPEDSALVCDCEAISYEEGYACAMRLLGGFAHVDGIFCMGDRYVPGVLAALDEMGKKVPEDIKIVGCDDSPLSRYVHGGFTTVRRHLDALAEAVALSLSNLIAGNPVADVVIPVELVRRRTT